MPRYEKNSNDTVLTLECLKTIEANNFLFIEDTTAIFTNINKEEGLKFLTSALGNLILKVETN